jgi:hypothetical protein
MSANENAGGYRLHRNRKWLGEFKRQVRQETASASLCQPQAPPKRGSSF